MDGNGIEVDENSMGVYNGMGIGSGKWYGIEWDLFGSPDWEVQNEMGAQNNMGVDGYGMGVDDNGIGVDGNCMGLQNGI